MYKYILLFLLIGCYSQNGSKEESYSSKRLVQLDREQFVEWINQKKYKNIVSFKPAFTADTLNTFNSKGNLIQLKGVNEETGIRIEYLLFCSENLKEKFAPLCNYDTYLGSYFLFENDSIKLDTIEVELFVEEKTEPLYCSPMEIIGTNNPFGGQIKKYNESFYIIEGGAFGCNGNNCRFYNTVFAQKTTSNWMVSIVNNFAEYPFNFDNQFYGDYNDDGYLDFVVFESEISDEKVIVKLSVYSLINENWKKLQTSDLNDYFVLYAYDSSSEIEVLEYHWFYPL